MVPGARIDTTRSVAKGSTSATSLYERVGYCETAKKPPWQMRLITGGDQGQQDGPGLVLAWHLLASAVLLFVPTPLVLGIPPWEISLRQAPATVGLPLSYLLAAGWQTRAIRRAAPTIALRSIGLLAAALAAFFLGLLMYPDIWYSRGILLLGLALTAVFILTPLLLRGPWLKVASAGLVITGGGALAVAPVPPETPTSPEPTVETQILATSHGALMAVHYGSFVAPIGNGGGIDVVDDGFVLATGEGGVYRLEFAADTDSLSLSEWPLHVPLNRDTFVGAAGQDVQPFRFRVTDILVHAAGDSIEFMASHHDWNNTERCFVLRVSTLVASRAELNQAERLDRWRTLYDTTPRLPIKSFDRGSPFVGHQSGGRLAILDAEHLIVTVGDHQFDGWNSERALSQDSTVDYGKTLVVDRNGHAERLTMDQRHPQGLLVDSAGRIWTTDHGPQGGDELHEIIPGANYGWPYVTYGTDYGDVVWPLEGQGEWDAADFWPPVFAWVPSIGVSNLIEVREGPVAEWRGDLLIGSLPARSLSRVRREAGRVVYLEPIDTGSRIRDLIERPDGEIILWANGGGILQLTGTSASEGAALFARCAGCHTTERGAGPQSVRDLWKKGRVRPVVHLFARVRSALRTLEHRAARPVPGRPPDLRARYVHDLRTDQCPGRTRGADRPSADAAVMRRTTGSDVLAMTPGSPLACRPFKCCGDAPTPDPASRSGGVAHSTRRSSDDPCDLLTR